MQSSVFLRFITASGATNLADGIATVAWAWLASLLTRDPLLIALVPVTLRMPWFLCAVPAGIVTDRVDRRRLILAMDALRAVAFAMAALAIWSALPLGDAPAEGVSSPALFIAILVAALTVGIAEVFRDNAAQTMLPAIVPKDRLERANGRLWSVELVGNALVGPALGAFLIAAALPLPFALNAVTYGLAIWLLLGLKGSFRPERPDQTDQTGQPGPTAAPNWRRELSEGWNFLKSAQLLRVLALITGTWNLLFHMVMIALVLHVQENLNLGARAYGLILAGGAVGGILGGLWAERVVRWLGPARSAQWMLFASAPAFAGVALAPNGFALGVVLAAFEFTGLVWNTVSVSYRQRVIPDVLLGRVNSLYRLLAWGMMPLGLILSGVIVRLADGVVARDAALIAPFVVAAIGGLLLTFVGWRALGRGFAQNG